MALAGCLRELEAAADAAARLGLDVESARSVLGLARERLAFPGSAYVLALAGGTGVGKSSLLNALAGTTVSAASVRRPTTSAPIAWVPSALRMELAPLLSWLGVDDVREHRDGQRNVAVLDLPDLDSIAREHAARVDELLPRVDAVVWVSDPEKYHDAVLHDDYLRRWAPRLSRQAIVVNKADRLPLGEDERVRADLRERLRAERLEQVPVLMAAAAPPEGWAGDGLAEVRAWLGEGVEAKQVVAARLGAQARAAVEDLAARAGLDSGGGQPLVSQERRADVAREAADEALAVLDVRGLERQAVAATRQVARPRGGGPLGRITALVYAASGRASAVADPGSFARRWRERATLVRAVQPIRRAVTEAAAEVPAALRPALLAVAEPRQVQERLSGALDRAVASPEASFEPPRSRVWPLIGIAQYAATAVLVVGVLWLVAAWLGAAGTVPATEVPLLGMVPQPVLLIAGGIFAGFVLARLLSLHAGLLGRRWARRLAAAVSGSVRREVGEHLLAPLDAIELARRDLSRAAGAAADC